MKCAKHPKRDAIAVCVSCGIGVCRDCEIKVVGRTHCKKCVEAGKAAPTESVAYPSERRVPVAAPFAAPTGKPSRAYFIIGAIGLIVLMVAANLMWAFSSLYIFLWGVPSYIFYIIQSAIFCAGGVMVAFGFYGLRRNYGSTMALATSIISFIFIWFMLIPAILYAILFSAGYPYYFYFSPLYMLYQIMYYLAYILAGVMIILWGCSLITVRIHLGNEGLGIAAGVLFIITGSFWCSTYLLMIGTILLIPTGILGIILLLSARVPT